MFIMAVANTVDTDKKSFNYAICGIMENLDSAVAKILRNSKNMSSDGDFPLAFIEEYGHSVVPHCKYRKMFYWDYEKNTYVEHSEEHLPEFNIIVKGQADVVNHRGRTKRCTVCLELLPVEEFEAQRAQCRPCRGKKMRARKLKLMEERGY